MGKLGGFLLARIIELQLISILIDAFEHATCFTDLWRIFHAMPELGRIGAVASIVYIIAIAGIMLRRIVAEAMRFWSAPRSVFFDGEEHAAKERLP